MPRFAVRIFGEHLEAVLAPLAAAGATITEPHYWVGYVGEDEPVGSSRFVVLEADDADEARRRVEDMLPPSGGYAVRDAEPMQEARAEAENCAVAGESLTVELLSSRHPPQEVVWTSRHGSDQRHLYAFDHWAVSPEGVPIYRFVRTLDPDELDPV